MMGRVGEGRPKKTMQMAAAAAAAEGTGVMDLAEDIETQDQMLEEEGTTQKRTEAAVEGTAVRRRAAGRQREDQAADMRSCCSLLGAAAADMLSHP